MAGDEAAEEETNFYLITLRGCRDNVIPNASIDQVKIVSDVG